MVLFVAAPQSLLDRPTVSSYTAGRSAPTRNFASSSFGGSEASGPYRRNRSGEDHRNVPEASSASSIPPANGPPASPIQSNRIAPGMPWEHIGTGESIRHTVRTASAPSSAVDHSSSSDGVVAAATVSSYDRRQRLRYADYDSTAPASPGWSAARSFPLSDTSTSINTGMDYSSSSSGAISSESHTSSKGGLVATRKRSAEAAHNAADDSGSHDDEEVNGKMSSGDESKMEETVTHAEETEAQRAQRVAEREQRLRDLAQELCPLLDRFGRVLTDVSPHLWELGDLDSSTTAAAASGSGNNSFNFETSLLNLLRDR